LASKLADSRARAHEYVTAALAHLPVDDLGRLRLRARQLVLATESERDTTGELALTVYRRVRRRQLAERPTLVRTLAAELGHREPNIILFALERVGLGQPSTDQLDTLADGLYDWQRGLRDQSGVSITPADAVELQRFAGLERQKWRQFVHSEGRELNRALLSLCHRCLNSVARASEFVRALQAIYRDWRAAGPSATGAPAQIPELINRGGPANTATLVALGRLRDVLVDAYPSAREAWRIASTVELSAPRPTAAGRSLSRLWFEILDTAYRRGVLDALLEQVMADERVASYRTLLEQARGAQDDRGDQP
jgi:hypothetical protein